jgi:hypothetical protein
MTNINNQGAGDQQIQVKVSDEVLRGAYANMAQIAHTGEEFILDFVNITPPSGSLVARVIVSPAHAKRLIVALQDNVSRFEKQFGTISSTTVPEQKIGFKTE